MSRVSVAIDRSDMVGAPAPIVISDDGAVYRFTEDGVGHVVQSVRTTTMPESVDTDGTEIIAFAKEATGLPLTVHIIGASTAAVETAKTALEDALYRLDYPVTRTVDGGSKTYGGGPCALVPARSTVDSGVIAAHFETYSVTIPFPNPNGT